MIISLLQMKWNGTTKISIIVKTFNDFNPIRSGVMKILRLRLVEYFGQVKDLDIRNIITPEQMTTQAVPIWIS
jgi:hypothetical protein